MSSNQSRTTARIKTDRETDDITGTVQLLVADKGNRTAIRKMLSEYFDVETSQTVQDADLYLIEDHLFSEHHEALREQVEQADPTFCPVVLIRRETTELAHPARDTVFHEGPMLLDDVIDAPIDRSLLIRRLHSLLVRRQQSQELSNHVSALEEREQDLRRFERGVESTGNGIVMTNRHGEIEYANPAFEKITGYLKSEVLGETPRILQPAGAADVFTDEFWETMIDREEWAGEVVIEHSDQRRSVVDTSIKAIHDDSSDVEGFVIVLNDITERIEQEQELQRREGELELLRQILTRYLRHNLRNDLNIILGYGEMVASDETLPDSLVQMAENIVKTAQQLREKSETARQFSTLLQQDTELSAYDLSEVVNECVQTISEQYPDVEFDIDVPEVCEIRARTGIQDAIEELIGNAMEHADTASPHVQIQLRNSNGARLVIEDNGPGISELELATLEKGEETPLSHSLGIGLWLSKWVIESVDGRLSFERLDPGTRVTATFPSPERVSPNGLDGSTLKERDQRLQTAIDRMTDAIIQVNASWEITFVDERAEEILNISADKILRKAFWDVFSDARGTQFEAVYRDVMDSRTSQHIEAYLSGINGWLSVYVYPEFDGGLSLYFRETTEQNRRQQALQQVRSRMELALRVNDSTVWEWDAKTGSVTTHPKPHGAFGTEITTGDEFIDAIHPEDRAQVQDALETAIETESPYSAEYRVHRGNETHWIEDYGELHCNEEDDSKRLIGVARDITGRKRREQELYRSKRAMDRAPAGITITDPKQEDNPLIYVNDRFCQLTGYTEAEVIGSNCRLLQGENTNPETVARLREAIDTEQPVTVELRNYRKDGTEFWNRLSIRPVYDEDGLLVNYIGFQQDVTEQHERQQELEETNALLSRLIETLPVGVLAENESRNVLAVNERLFTLFEMPGTPEDIIGADCEQMAEEISDIFATPEQFIERTNELITEREPTNHEELVLADGRTFRRSCRPIDLPDGEGHLWLYRDVTAHVEREQEREITIEFLQNLYDVATDTTLTANEKITRLLEFGPNKLDLPRGYLTRIEVSEETPETGTQRVIEASGDHELLQPGNSCPLSKSYCRKTIKTDGVVVIPDALAAGWDGDPAYELFDLGCYIGTRITVNNELYGTVFFASKTPREEPFSDVEQTFVQLMSQLVSYELERDYARKELEQQNERLKEFANVVSHDLRNPLSVVKGRLELAQEDSDSEHLRAMKTAVERMNRIIEDVLWLAREGQDIGTMESVVIQDATDVAWNIVADSAPEAELHYKGSEFVEATLEADEDRFHQLLENLLRNAIEHGGSNVTVTVGLLDDGFYVEDDGPGIPETSRDDVFTAGYSTSEDGTGFGLSIVKQVVDAHNWEISVTDGDNGGARFEITGVKVATE